MPTAEQPQMVRDLGAMLADSRKSYEAIAGRVQQEHLRNLLRQAAADRHRLWTELNGPPGTEAGGGTMWGAVHRTILAVRDLVYNSSEVNLLVEFERQEVDLVNQYRRVLDMAELPTATRTMLQGHWDLLRKDAAQARALREGFEELEEGG